VVWLNSVHGRHATWVRNLEATPEVRIKLSGRWYHAHATVHEYDQAVVQRFSLYARSGPRTLGIDPALVRVELRPYRRKAVSETKPVEISMPAAVGELHLLDRVDYEDAFSVDTPVKQSPEQWIRAFAEDAPRWFQLPWAGIGNILLGAQFGPLFTAPGYVVGPILAHRNHDARHSPNHSTSLPGASRRRGRTEAP